MPIPYCTVAVSPWTTITSSRGTPNSSLTIWAKVVSWPCPWGETPVSTVTLPEGSKRTVLLSQPIPPPSLAGLNPDSSM